MLSIRRFAVLTAFLCSLTLLTRAQVNTSSVRGTVSDPSGAVIPGATVILHSDATEVDRRTLSGVDGEYNFEFVPAGTYTLAVSHAGFEVARRQDVNLSAAEVARIDFAMAVGSAQQSVEVSSGDEQFLDTTTAQQTGELSSLQINELPVAKTDWTSILQLSPSLSTFGGSKAPVATSITMNGLPPAAFNLTIDGTNATSDPEQPAYGFYGGPNIINSINNDAIAEIVVAKGIAPASVSGTMSGNVDIVTKGGGNDYHGSLFEINDLSAYNARNQFLTSKPRSNFNEYGGSIGGHIFPNKLFFFGSYEGARVSSSAPITGAVPSPYLKSISPSVYAPFFTWYPTVTQPASDPTSDEVQYFGPGSLRQNDGNGVARLDYNLTPNDLITVRYVRARPYKNQPYVVILDPEVTTGHTDAFNGAYTHVAKRVTSLSRFGYNRIRLNRLDEGFPIDVEEIELDDIDSNGSENFTIAGDYYTGEQQFIWNHGRHTVETGLIVQRQDAGRIDLNTTVLVYSTLSDFVANTPDSVQITFDLNPFNLYTYQFGAYIQDDINMTKHLTLNLGLRYDYFTVPQEDNNRVFNRGVDPANPQLGPGFGPYRPANSMYNADRNNVQPRLGLAWSVGPKATVLRAGAGLFVNPHPLFGGPVPEVQDSATVPFRITLNRAQAQSAGIKYPLPRSQYSATLANLQSSGTISSNFTNSAINGNFPDPYSTQWMLGIEQALPWSSVFEIDYVGNRGLKENMTPTENLPNRTTGVAPVPTYSQFQYFYAGDASNYNAMQIQYRKPFAHNFSYGASFAWGRNMSFGDANLLIATAPQDNNNIKAEYGRTPFDVRDKLVINGLYELPLNEWTRMHNYASRMVFGGWQLSGVFAGYTGLPSNITYKDSYPSDRPDFTPGVNQYLSNSQATHHYLNPAAFTPVAVSSASGAEMRPGTLGRYAVDQPGFLNLDAGLGKNFDFTEKVRFQLKMDAFNVLNHTNLSGLVTNRTSGSFGTFTNATARTVQLTGRLTF